MAKIQVKLVKSVIGAIPRHRKTVQALGLKKLGQVKEHNDIPQIRGMVKQVEHLVKIVE